MATEKLSSESASGKTILGPRTERTMKPGSRFFLGGIFIVVGLILIGLGLRYRSSHQQAVAPNTSTDRLSSFYQNKSDYDEAFITATSSTPSTVPAYAAITSHHFLAKELIARTMTGIDPTRIKTVLLISPDHFNAIPNGDVLGGTTLASWDTPYGEAVTNKGQIEAMTTLSQIKILPRVFLTEHGIYTVVPFLKKQFPTASLVPLVLRGSDDFDSYARLGEDLRQFFDPKETLVIVSSDFSHEKTQEQAKAADQKSIIALQGHTLPDIQNIDSDCKVCMAALFGYLDSSYTQFQLIENKNSYDFSGQDPQTVTSYVSGYFVPQLPGADQPSSSLIPVAQPAPVSGTSAQNTSHIKLLFGGDLMFDRNIRLKLQQFGTNHAIGGLKQLFDQQTVVIANLEGPVTNNPSRSVGSAPGSTSNFIFTFDPSIPSMLFDNGIKVVNLGNNHISNFGEDGVKQSKEYLSKAKVEFFGDTGTELESKDRILILERSGVKIGLVNYNQFTTDGMEHAMADIKYVRPNVDILFLFTHWGNEYVPEANEVIQTQAHRFIDSGVDVIIGTHPHVIENVEVYKDKRIYYSLGNLVFDQYFSPETQVGMLVGVDIDPATKALNFSEYKVKLKVDGQTVLDAVQ